MTSHMVKHKQDRTGKYKNNYINNLARSCTILLLHSAHMQLNTDKKIEQHCMERWKSQFKYKSQIKR